MKTSDFIAKSVDCINHGQRLGDAHCGSVIRRDGYLYSYGRHYPLLFQVFTRNGPLWVVNDSGYSATTSRHIHWARPYADISAPVGVYGVEDPGYNHVERAVRERVNKLYRELHEKKRKDTWVYAGLARRLEDARRDYRLLTGSDI